MEAYAIRIFNKVHLSAIKAKPPRRERAEDINQKLMPAQQNPWLTSAFRIDMLSAAYGNEMNCSGTMAVTYFGDCQSLFSLSSARRARTASGSAIHVFLGACGFCGVLPARILCAERGLWGAVVLKRSQVLFNSSHYAPGRARMQPQPVGKILSAQGLPMKSTRMAIQSGACVRQG